MRRRPRLRVTRPAMTPLPTHGCRHGSLGDTGTVSLAFASLALALLVAFGLVVDGSGRLTAYQRAHAVAGEAARAAGQAVDAGAALSGTATRVEPEAARQAATTHLAAAGVTGSVAVSGDGTRITVTADVPYRAIVLAGTDRTVSATAEARLVRGITSEIP